jgi:hypothetical protein
MREPNRPKSKNHAAAASMTTSSDVDVPVQQQQHKSPRPPSSSPPFTPPAPSSTAAAMGISQGPKRAPSHPHPAPRSPPGHVYEGVFEASYGMGMIPTIAAGEGFGVSRYVSVGVGAHAQVGRAYGPAGFHQQSTRGQAAELMSPVLVEGCGELAGSTTTWVSMFSSCGVGVLMPYFLGCRVVLSRLALGTTGRRMRVRMQARCSRR